MSRSDKDNQQPKSEVKQAIEKADTTQIKENLEINGSNKAKQSDTPQQLNKDEATPFIDDEARTDK